MRKIQVAGLLSLAMLVAPINSAEVHAGIKFGGSVQHMWSIEEGLSKVQLGGTGGLFSRIRLFDIFALQPELRFAMKGGKTSASRPQAGVSLFKTDTTITFETNIKVIECPFLLKFYPLGSRYSQPNLFFGPFYEFMFARELKAEYSGIRGSQVTAIQGAQPDMGEDNPHNYGLVIGGGIDFGLGTFDLRYTIGFQDVEKTGNEPFSTAPKLRARSGTLSVMFGFLFGMS